MLQRKKVVLKAYNTHTILNKPRDPSGVLEEVSGRRRHKLFKGDDTANVDLLLTVGYQCSQRTGKSAEPICFSCVRISYAKNHFLNLHLLTCEIQCYRSTESYIVPCKTSRICPCFAMKSEIGNKQNLKQRHFTSNGSLHIA